MMGFGGTSHDGRVHGARAKCTVAQRSNVHCGSAFMHPTLALSSMTRQSLITNVTFSVQRHSVTSPSVTVPCVSFTHTP